MENSLSFQDLYREIGHRISVERSKRKIKQFELATSIKLSQSSMVHIEKGKQRISIDKLFQIGLVLGINPKELFPDEIKSKKTLDSISGNPIPDEVENAFNSTIK